MKIFSTLFAAVMLFSTIAVAHPVTPITISVVNVTNEIDQCKNNHTLAWCTPVEAGKLQNIDIVFAVEKMARKNFTYKLHPKHDWSIDLNSVKNGKDWTGDCNSLSETVLQLAAENGFKTDHMWNALVSTTGYGGTEDHHVGIVEDDHGYYWVVGDTMATSPYRFYMFANGYFKNGETPYKIKFIEKVSDGMGNWYDLRVVNDGALIKSLL